MKEWKPSRNQLAVLALARQLPELRGYRSLAKASGLHYNTVKAWRKDPRFLAWWNREMVASARNFLGPALGELVRIISDPKVSDSTRVKACKIFFEGIEKDVAPTQASTAVLLEAFGPDSRAAIAMRRGAGTEEIRIMVEAGPGRRDDLAAGEQVGAVELTRHPEAGVKLAVRIAEAAQEEDNRTRAEDAGRRTSGLAEVEAPVPEIVGSRPRPKTSEEEDQDG